MKFCFQKFSPIINWFHFFEYKKNFERNKNFEKKRKFFFNFEKKRKLFFNFEKKRKLFFNLEKKTRSRKIWTRQQKFFFCNAIESFWKNWTLGQSIALESGKKEKKWKKRKKKKVGIKVGTWSHRIRDKWIKKRKKNFWYFWNFRIKSPTRKDPYPYLPRMKKN